MNSIIKAQNKIINEMLNINTNFSLIIIDIDFFIRYCMKLTKRECNEIMFHIKTFFFEEFKDKKIYNINGTDEFFIICKQYDNYKTFELVETVLSKFRKQRFAQFIGNEYKFTRMTFSAGIASYPHNGHKNLIYNKALVALFTAKSLRRNHIISYQEETVRYQRRILLKDLLSIETIVGKWGLVGQTNKRVDSDKSFLWEPQAMATSEKGELFIADQNNHRIVSYDGYYVKPVVGTGKFGVIKDSIKANKGALNKPTGLYVFKNNLYITDTGNDIVVRLDLLTYRISSICGTGKAGYSGDGGFANKAELNKPGGIVVDNNENIYINDIANNVIRRIDNKGIISTFAGNGDFGFNGDNIKSVNASFNEIYGICIDNDRQNLYIADYLNHRIRRINITTGIISTVVGIGRAGYSGDGEEPKKACLNRPVAVCLDENNNLYIAESGNHSVRIVIANKNKIYTLVGGCGMGTGQNDVINDYKLANPNSISVFKSNLYILDGANNRICKLNLKEVLDE